MKLRVHAVEERVKTLGPGVRYVVWVQGCERRCPGCMSPETRDLLGGYVKDTEELAREIMDSGCEGLTISGGEPFLQPAALADMIEQIRKETDMGVIIYTGNKMEELRGSGDSDVHRLLACCDLLVDGAYIQELNDGKSLRGSSNQRVIPLTARYEKNAADYGREERRVEFAVHADSIRMIGVPSSKMMEQLRDIIW